MKQLSVFCALFMLILQLSAQPLHTYNVGVVLPFQAENTTGKIERFLTAHDVFTANRIKLDDDASMALDYYQGTLLALQQLPDSVKINLYVYDNQNSDSVTQELLKTPTIKKLDVLIGPAQTPQAKMVADFCVKNKIVNIQPFTPSKSVGLNNPYHLKLSPTLDSHIDYLFLSITDSFPGANVIIYSPGDEINLSAARRMDSLLAQYNKTASQKFTVALLNTKNMMLNGKKTTAAEQLRSGRKNVLMITSFEENFVNGTLRVLYAQREKFDIILYGMPNWMSRDRDILRLDYINDYQTRYSDAFYISETFDSSQFALQYQAQFYQKPNRNAVLGYDVTRFLQQALTDYGKDFLPQIVTQRYSGEGYKFDILRNTKGTDTNYYESKFVNVFMINSYRPVKVR